MMHTSHTHIEKMNNNKSRMKNILLLVGLCASCNLYGQKKGADFEPIALQCEHLVNPLAIDVEQPRFTWMLKDDRQGAKQVAYQVIVGTDSLSIVNNKGNIWDTGKLMKDNILVRYAGKDLHALTRYFWKVTVWDKDGRPSSSDVASFETGMMSRFNWKGAWISDHANENDKPAPYFRKKFTTKKTVKYARAYIAAAGLYELSLNGAKVGENVLDPMYTRFDKRLLYVVHDVTAQIKSGNNAIGVILGMVGTTISRLLYGISTMRRGATVLHFAWIYVLYIPTGRKRQSHQSAIGKLLQDRLYSIASTPVNIMMRDWSRKDGMKRILMIQNGMVCGIAVHLLI